MKKKPVLWFYPVWNAFWFLVVMTAMIFVGARTFWTIVAGILLIASEMPILLFKNRVYSKNRAKMDAYILYILGTVSYCFSLVMKLVPMDYIFAFVVGISGMLLLILKMRMLDSYTRAIESL